MQCPKKYINSILFTTVGNETFNAETNPNNKSKFITFPEIALNSSTQLSLNIIIISI